MYKSKKLSSDLLYFSGLGSSLIAVLIGNLFIHFVVPPAGRVIAGCIINGLFIVAIVLQIKKLHSSKQIFVDGDKLIFKSYFSNEQVEVPFKEIVSINKKPQSSMITLRKSYKITYKLDGQISYVFFLKALDIYTEDDVEGYLGLRQNRDPYYSKLVHTYPNSNPGKIETSMRLSSAVADHVIMTIVFGIFAMPVIVYHAVTREPQHVGINSLFKWDTWLISIGFALYFCKDCIHGQSPAKRLMKLQVVNYRSNQIANPIRCVIRDLFLVFWPIEFIMLLINPSRRLGDFVVGTMVIRYNPELERPKLSYVQLAIAFLMANIWFMTVQLLIFR